MRQATATISARAAIRAWPLDPTLAHLVVFDLTMIPTVDDVERWLADAYTPSASPSAPGPATPSATDTSTTTSLGGPLAVRTGALYPAAAAAFLEAGFEIVDRLALLERRLATSGPGSRLAPRERHGVVLGRLRRRDIDAAALIDQDAFPAGWRNDSASLTDIIDATPQARARMAFLPGTSRRRARPQRAGRLRAGTRDPVGFAITGRAGTTGYLQRIAVTADARRSGVALRLVDDAMLWLSRRGVDRVLVNTATDNDAALRLYASASFVRLADELVVLEHRRRA